MENQADTEGRVSRNRMRETPGAESARSPYAASAGDAQTNAEARSDAGQAGSLRSTGAQTPTAEQPNRAQNYASYQQTTPHITQEPIADDPTRYVTPERYTTLDGARPRQHMGVATSDPQYLPTTETGRTGQRRPTGEGGVTGPAHPISDKRAPLHYDRYLETPKKSKSIFTKQRQRERRRTHAIIALVVVLIVVAIVLVWFFVLR